MALRFHPRAGTAANRHAGQKFLAACEPDQVRPSNAEGTSVTSDIAAVKRLRFAPAAAARREAPLRQRGGHGSGRVSQRGVGGFRAFALPAWLGGLG